MVEVEQGIFLRRSTRKTWNKCYFLESLVSQGSGVAFATII